MTKTIHLTNDLQVELNKIGSSIKLQSDNNSGIKGNSKDRVCAFLNARVVSVSTCIELDGWFLQLEDAELMACVYTTNHLSEIALIIDKWLGKQFDIFTLSNEHEGIQIDKKYRDIKTLTVDEILENRWAYFSDRIATGRICFRQDLFEVLRKHFSLLYPYFSHDNLLFSDKIESMNDDFRSPVIFCDKDEIWVGFFNDNSEQEGQKAFKTKDIEQALDMTKQLLPKGLHKVINPWVN